MVPAPFLFVGNIPNALHESSGDGLDGFHSCAEPAHGLAVAFQFTIREIPYVQIGDAGERRPSELCTDIFLAVLRGHQEEPLDRLPGGTEGKIKEAHDS